MGQATSVIKKISEKVLEIVTEKLMEFFINLLKTKKPVSRKNLAIVHRTLNSKFKIKEYRENAWKNVTKALLIDKLPNYAKLHAKTMKLSGEDKENFVNLIESMKDLGQTDNLIKEFKAVVRVSFLFMFLALFSEILTFINIIF